jgi:hypothetical protein
MKIINILIAALFALFAIFQINDPDGFTWVVLYGYVAIMAVLAALGKYNLALLIPGVAIFALYFIYLIPSVIEFITSGEDLMNQMAPDKLYIEQTREAGGLLMGLIALIYLVTKRKKYGKAF